MTISNSSAARRAGFKVNDAAILDGAAISMAKIGTRSLYVSFPGQAWSKSGTSVAVATDGVFNVITLPNANSGVLRTSFELPQEWVSGTNITLDIYWKSSGITGNAKFSVALASRAATGASTAEDTQTVTTATQATANKLNKSSVTFAASLFTAGDVVGIEITRDPADAADTLASDVSFVLATLIFTGRG